jgi:hypothetical protein
MGFRGIGVQLLSVCEEKKGASPLGGEADLIKAGLKPPSRRRLLPTVGKLLNLPVTCRTNYS